MGRYHLPFSNDFTVLTAFNGLSLSETDSINLTFTFAEPNTTMDPSAFTSLAHTPPHDLSHHFSHVTKNRRASLAKSFYKYFQVPDVGNLAGGMPNVDFFPFDTLEAQVARPDRVKTSSNHSSNHHPNEQQIGHASRSSNSTGTSHLTTRKSSTPKADPDEWVDLSKSLQYGNARGYPPLVSFLRQFTREVMHPNAPYRNGPEILLTCGSTDGFAKTIDLIVDPWYHQLHNPRDRPAMLCEAFTYGNILSQVEPKGVQVVPVEVDGEGMLAAGPGGLKKILENWDLKNGRRPHFLYTVTIGQNPTSGVLSVERRREIYALCCKYDILIVEDDPYWFLQYPSASEEEALSRGLPIPEQAQKQRLAESSGYDFIDSLVPSYMSMDTEGRVIRLDTFSKTIAPGCRLGWITAQPALIERLERITEAHTQQPSGFAQSMIAELLMGPKAEATKSFFKLPTSARNGYKGWKMDGWVRWLSGLRGGYERRMNTMCSILDDHAYQVKQSTPVKAKDADWGVITKTRLMSFDWPRGGMFVWLRIHYELHPLWMAKGRVVPLFDGPTLSMAFLKYCTHKPHMVLGAPGSMFSATPEINAERGWAYLRVCFAGVSEEDVESCSTRFGNALQKFWRIKRVEEIEQLVKEVQATNIDEIEGLVNMGYGVMGC